MSYIALGMSVIAFAISVYAYFFVKTHKFNN